MQGDSHPSKLAVRDRRERVIAQLAESFARDELSVDDFEARIDAAYCSTTDAEFDALIADLRRRDLPAGDAMVVAPTLRIDGSAIFGSVVVKTLPPARVRSVVEQFRARRLLRP